jgi:hypothetical protein
MRHLVFTLILVFAAGLLAVGCPGRKESAPTQPGPASPANDKVGVTLFAMSECPYGIPAEKIVHKVSQVLGRAMEPRLVFIVNEDASGKLQSMHGEGELRKDMIHACAGSLAPAKQYDFVVRMNESAKDWTAVAGELGLDASAIEKCLQDGTAERLIRDHLAETKRLNVSASPTILLNGEPYRGGINSRDLFDAICRALGPRQPPVCANPPDTLSRTDASASGSCGSPAEQKLPEEYIDRAPLDHTIIYEPAAIDHSRLDEVLAQTKRLYPNVNVKKIDAGSNEGQKLLKKYGLTQLPAYLFPSDLDRRKNFKVMERLVQKVGDAYVLSPKVGSNIAVNRPRQAKTVDVFFTPFSGKALRILLDVQDLLSRADVRALGVKINLRPYALIENGEIVSQMGPPEIEEMLRVLAILDVQPAKVWPYLQARLDNPASSWWEDYATKAGLNPAEIMKSALSEKTMTKLADNSNLAAELAIADEFAVLVENREVARLEGKDAFKSLLFKLGK